MSDPFAAALAVLHSAAGSVAADYTPAGGIALAAPIGVIWSQGSQDGSSAGDRRVADTNMFDVRRADVELPKRGDTLSFTHPFTGLLVSFKINGAPILDVEGISWACPAEPR